ncbi:MAG: helix-turn-helix transcriptional regulator [Chlorobi bacterium]|nr:helix-turn-helix transcriptional regulator [Chlorobiota bacterium]
MAREIKCDINVGNRIRQIADTVYNTHGELAKKLKMTNGVLSNYIHSKIKPGYTFLDKMIKLGFSATWIISGHGRMFAENEVGEKLNAEFGEFTGIFTTIIKHKIIEKYGTLSKFCAEFDFDEEALSAALYRNDYRHYLSMMNMVSEVGLLKDSHISHSSPGTINGKEYNTESRDEKNSTDSVLSSNKQEKMAEDIQYLFEKDIKKMIGRFIEDGMIESTKNKTAEELGEEMFKNFVPNADYIKKEMLKSMTNIQRNKDDKDKD